MIDRDTENFVYMALIALVWFKITPFYIRASSTIVNVLSTLIRNIYISLELAIENMNRSIIDKNEHKKEENLKNKIEDLHKEEALNTKNQKNYWDD